MTIPTSNPSPSSPDDQKILDVLERAAARDREKGGDGSRLTAEIAERLGCTTAQARRRLERLHEHALIEAEQEKGGAPIFWRALSKEPDNG